MKMYILIRDSVPDAMAPVIAAHASLACYKKFEQDENMQRWIKTVFKKVVCKVNATEFDNAKREGKHLVLTESALNDAEVCLTFCPRESYGKQFKFFRMWHPDAKI